MLFLSHTMPIDRSLFDALKKALGPEFKHTRGWQLHRWVGKDSRSQHLTLDDIPTIEDRVKARIDVCVEKECRYQSSKPFLRVAHVRMEPGGVWSYRQNKT